MAKGKHWTKSNSKGTVKKRLKNPESLVEDSMVDLLNLIKFQLSLLTDFKLATAENFTGGLLTQLICEDSELASSLDRGFILNDDLSMKESLGISENILQQHERNSVEIAEAMAKGALLHSNAKLAIAITAITDPKLLSHCGSKHQLSFAACYQNIDDPSILELKSYQKEFVCRDRNFVCLVCALEAFIFMEKIFVELIPETLEDETDKDDEFQDAVKMLEHFIFVMLAYKDAWDQGKKSPK